MGNRYLDIFVSCNTIILYFLGVRSTKLNIKKIAKEERKSIQNIIEGRMLAEKRKHPKLDWIKIASIRITNAVIIWRYEAINKISEEHKKKVEKLKEKIDKVFERVFSEGTCTYFCATYGTDDLNTNDEMMGFLDKKLKELKKESQRVVDKVFGEDGK